MKKKMKKTSVQITGKKYYFDINWPLVSQTDAVYPNKRAFVRRADLCYIMKKIVKGGLISEVIFTLVPPSKKGPSHSTFQPSQV